VLAVLTTIISLRK
jgi:hypothetical protein